MGQQVGECPFGAGGGPIEIAAADPVDDLGRSQNDGAVERTEVGFNGRHKLTISISTSSGNAYADPVSKRPDLAAMLAPLMRELIAAEQPVLDAHGLTMWGYVVLLALDRSSVRTQAALAEAIGADKTRIIRTLDDLQRQGFIEREADPDDRRVRLLAITEAGRAVKDSAQREIQQGEERWLGELSADERAVFLRVLQRLTPE
ncbi:transcriptional regulator [Mycolicibacterium fortuitum subsp. acetamidolyticum]|nr:transcriptional regulator [Mycolicibacterium fortuitum subsp. acetamidolyticum]